MSVQRAFIVGIHRYCFRAGQVGEIVGVKWVQIGELSFNNPPRLCYKVRFIDGAIDYVAMVDVEMKNWTILSESALQDNMIPPVSK